MSDVRGFCGECLEEFRLDDAGGYNPPCKCGYACRGCCSPDVCPCDGGDERDDDDPAWDDFDSPNPD